MPSQLTTGPEKGVLPLDNKLHKEAVKKAIQPKFRGKTELTAKYIPQYPVTAEREMKRVVSGYMRILNREVKAHLPEIMTAYQRERRGDSRFDDLSDLKRELRKVFQTVAEAVEKIVGSYDLRAQIESLAVMVKNTSLREWKRTVKRTLGINLLNDYYDGSFYEAILQEWIAQNVSRIQSIPAQELGEMERIISEGFMNSKPISEIGKEIQHEYNVTRSKALFLAKDQIGTLNAQITRRQQEDAGVEEYKWDSSHDERVRECHRALDGQTFRWDSPPAMWYRKKGAIVYNGRHCHPGEDYGCRCCALPVFKLEKTDLPIQGEAQDAETVYGALPELAVSVLSFLDDRVK